MKEIGDVTCVVGVRWHVLWLELFGHVIFHTVFGHVKSHDRNNHIHRSIQCSPHKPKCLSESITVSTFWSDHFQARDDDRRSCQVS